MTASSTIYREFFGKDRVDEVHWTPGHVSERLPDFHIAKIGPEQANGMWTFATIGAWRATEQDKTSLEFVAVALGEGTAVVWNLALTALLHAGPRENRLGVGHRVPIGERWVEGLSLEVILVSLP